MKYSLILISLFSFSSSICFSQNQRNTIDVSININADELFKNRLQSLITREIRSFDDIRIVNQNYAYYSITIVALENKINNFTTGYFSSVLVTRIVDPEPLIRALASLEAVSVFDREAREKIHKEYSDSKGEIIRSYLEGSIHNVFNILLADSDLENLAKRIIAEIDVEVFEYARRFYLPYLNNMQYLEQFRDNQN